MRKGYFLFTAFSIVNLIGHSQAITTPEKLKLVRFEVSKAIKKLNVKEMACAYNYTEFLGKDTSIYYLHPDSSNNMPYEYFFQALTNHNAKEIERGIYDVPLKIVVEDR